MSKSFRAARLGGSHVSDLPIYQINENYFVVNTSVLPYPLPIHPTWSQIGVGFIPDAIGAASQADPSPYTNFVLLD
jgi:hypothetical protein